MQCAESLRVQAFFDGELDALAAAEVERHLERCAECRALLQDLGETRTLLRTVPLGHAPAHVQARLARLLDEEAAAARASRRPARGGVAPLRRLWRRVPAFWAGAGAGLSAAACAALLAWWLVLPVAGAPLLDELTAAHVRSLMPAHLTDVISSDHHTVKPWFAGHADVSPLVADFAPQGYPLLGGRADYLDGHRAAVVVYTHGAHVINVFSWPAAGRAVPERTSHNGYHMLFWRDANVEYCAVSDAGWSELEGLVGLLRDLGARDAHG